MLSKKALIMGETNSPSVAHVWRVKLKISTTWATEGESIFFIYQ
jgi:hypothetical protein